MFANFVIHTAVHLFIHFYTDFNIEIYTSNPTVYHTDNPVNHSSLISYKNLLQNMQCSYTPGKSTDTPSPYCKACWLFNSTINTQLLSFYDFNSIIKIQKPNPTIAYTKCHYKYRRCALEHDCSMEDNEEIFGKSHVKET